MLRYNTGETAQKWTRTELMGMAGAVVLLLCIWAVISWRNYEGDETQHSLDKARTQLAEAKTKIASLEASVAQKDKQIADASDKILALTSVAARAPQLPVIVRQWKDSPTTYAIALQNQSDDGISVHITVSNPDRSRPREQDCYIPAQRAINTPLRIFPNDTVIVTASGFTTRTETLDQTN